MTSSRLFFRSVTCTRWAMRPGQVRAALEERARGAAAEVAGGGQVGGAWGAAQHLPLPHGTAELMAELQALVAGCNSTRALQVALCSPSRRRWCRDWLRSPLLQFSLCWNGQTELTRQNAQRLHPGSDHHMTVLETCRCLS